MYKYWMSKYNSYKRFTKNNKKSIFYKDKNIMILPESYKNKTKIDIELKVQTKKLFYSIIKIIFILKLCALYQSDKTEAF